MSPQKKLIEAGTIKRKQQKFSPVSLVAKAINLHIVGFQTLTPIIRRNPGWILNSIAISSTLCGAYALKRFYSTASVDDLRWVLGPTASIVTFFTQTKFIYEPQVGYLSDAENFLLVNSCSGINFMIACFCMLVLGLVWRLRPWWGKALLILLAVSVAYTTTLVANSLRVIFSLSDLSFFPDGLEFSPDTLHQLEGITVYYSILSLVFFLMTKAIGVSKQARFSGKS